MADDSTEPETDAAIAAELGMEVDEPDAPDDDQQDEGEGEDQESRLEDLPQSWQDEIKRLRGENASQRIRLREATKASKAAPADGQTETSEQIEARVREDLRREYGVRIARADVKAALVGVVADGQIDRIVGKLDLSQYVGDDGETDKDAVASLRDDYVTLLGPPKSKRTGHSRQAGTGGQAKSNADLFAEALNL